MGIIFSIIAGAAMSVQGVMNTRLSERTGLLEANAVVQGTAFALSVLAALFFGKGGLKELSSVSRLYLWGGVLGMLITVTVMLGMNRLSPAFAVSVILIAQLITAAAIDALGIMGTEKIPLTWNKLFGAAVMIGGIVLFEWKR